MPTVYAAAMGERSKNQDEPPKTPLSTPFVHWTV
jgi:hypothetical protein